MQITAFHTFESRRMRSSAVSAASVDIAANVTTTAVAATAATFAVMHPKYFIRTTDT